MKRRTVVLWILALVITVSAAIYQRRTGPTYPLKGTVALGGESMALELTRSHGGPDDQPVVLTVPDRTVTAEMKWRRFPTSDSWQTVPFTRQGDELRAALPHQPPAGKLEYQVRLARGAESVIFPDLPAVTRFKNADPVGVLIPHVLAMFLCLLWSTRAGLEAVVDGSKQRRLAWIAFALLIVGGFILGPIMQKLTFGSYWTGIPYGYDLTDNKTLFFAVAWAFALFRLRNRPSARYAVLVAAIVTLVVFAIPHSVWGSQINWNAQGTGLP